MSCIAYFCILKYFYCISLILPLHLYLYFLYKQVCEVADQSSHLLGEMRYLKLVCVFAPAELSCGGFLSANSKLIRSAFVTAN